LSGEYGIAHPATPATRLADRIGTEMIVTADALRYES
jgi:hypothetical protein